MTSVSVPPQLPTIPIPPPSSSSLTFPPPLLHINPRSDRSPSPSSGHPRAPIPTSCHPSSSGPEPPPSSPRISVLPSPPSLSQPRPDLVPPALPSSNSPSLRSYAQAARAGRGPGFVRAHAIEVEPFARIPRTGANIICGSREGMPSFSFVSSDLPKVEEIYTNALVMKFAGGRPSLEASHKEISSWGMEKSFSIGPLSSRAFLIRFQDSKDLLKVLTRPSTLLITFPYKVFRWHNLCHLKEDSCLAPVWISLPRLPLQCFIPEFLESVGNKLGRFLCFDRATTTLARPSAARICVELDLRKAPPQVIWIGLFEGFKQPIIYERLPKFCNGCHMLGHTTLECSKSCNEVPPTQAPRRQARFHNRPPTVRQNATDTLAAISQGGHVQQVTPTTTATAAPPNPLSSGLSQEQDSSVQLHPPTGQRDVLRESPASPLRSTSPLHPPPPVTPHSTQFPPSAPTSSTPADTIHIPAPALKEPPPILISKSNSRKTKSKKKSVSFNLPLQSNLSANIEFWNAVNTQVSNIEHTATNSSNQSAPANLSVDPIVGEPLPHSNLEASLIDHSSDESSGSSIAADSPPSSHRALGQPSQYRPADQDILAYHSEGEDQSTEHSPFQGHNTDELLDKLPQNSKRNKRHPDQPLKVQLRVRKDPPAPHL